FQICVPALFTRMSSRPNRDTVSATKRSTSGLTPTSADTNITLRPSASISAVVRAPAAASRSATTMSQPLRASSSAIPFPIPLLAPVISATRDSSGSGIGEILARSFHQQIRGVRHRFTRIEAQPRLRRGAEQDAPAIYFLRREFDRHPAFAVMVHI